MSKTKNPVRKFLGYVPSLKEKHEATIVEGKAIVSKGGSIRYTLRGEYNGRKTLPKTVSKADFEGVYGFDAKAAESVIILGFTEDGEQKVKGHMIGKKEKDGFIPEHIQPIEHNLSQHKNLSGFNFTNHAESYEDDGWHEDMTDAELEQMLDEQMDAMKQYKLRPCKVCGSIFIGPEDPSEGMLIACDDCGSEFNIGGETTLDAKDADTVGSPSPASVEPPAPSDTPFPQEPSNENFSADVEMVQCEDPSCDEMMGIDEGLSYGGFSYCEYCYDQVMMDERQNDVEDDYDVEVKEAFGFGKDDAEPEEEKPKEQEFTVVLQEGDKLELTDIEEDDTEVGEPKEEDNTEDEENEEKEAEMDDCFTDEELLHNARIDIERQIKNGTMYAIGGEPEPFDDGENFYTIVNLYAQYHKDEDKAEKILWEMFREEYPQYLGTEQGKLNAEHEEGTRTFKITDIWYDTYDEEAEGMQGIKPFHDKHGYKQSHDQPDPSEMTIILDEDEGWGDRDLDMELGDAISDESGFCVYHYNWDEVKEAENYEAVSAKVTRPVKEEEDEESEDGEGMSTLAKVGLGVGALAVGAAILGAEDEGESDYWAGENAHWRAENFSADTSDIALSQEEIEEIERGMDIDLSSFKQRIANGASAKNVIETYRIRGRHNRKELMDYERRLYETETVGSPSPSGPPSIPEPAEATGSEPSNEHFSAECGDGGQNPCKECGGHPCPRCNAPHISDTDSIETEDGYVCLPCATDAETREDYFWNDLLGGYMTRKEMLEQYPERKDEIDNSRNPEMREDYQPYQESYQPKEIDIEEIERLGMEKDEREIKKLMDEKGLTYEEARQMKMDKAIDQIPHWEAEATGSEPSNENFEATTGYGYDDPPERMTDEEAWLEMYDDYLEDENSPMTLEDYKKWVIEAREEDYQMQVKYEQRLKDEGLDDLGNPIGTEYGFETETVGSPSPSGPSSTPEPAEATGSEPSNENMNAEYSLDDPSVFSPNRWKQLYDGSPARESISLEQFKGQYKENWAQKHNHSHGGSQKEQKECGGCGSVYEDEDVYTTCELCGKDSCDNCGDSQGPCNECRVMFCYACSGCGDCGYVCQNCECDCNSKEAESKNLKMALGITALGIGLAAILGKDKITKLFDRFGL